MLLALALLFAQSDDIDSLRSIQRNMAAAEELISAASRSSSGGAAGLLQAALVRQDRAIQELRASVTQLAQGPTDDPPRRTISAEEVRRRGALAWRALVVAEIVEDGDERAYSALLSLAEAVPREPILQRLMMLQTAGRSAEALEGFELWRECEIDLKESLRSIARLQADVKRLISADGMHDESPRGRWMADNAHRATGSCACKARFDVGAAPTAKEADAISRLIETLPSVDLQKREDAERLLSAYGERALAQLRAAQGDSDPEVRLRTARVLDAHDLQPVATGALLVMAGAGADIQLRDHFAALIDGSRPELLAMALVASICTTTARSDDLMISAAVNTLVRAQRKSGAWGASEDDPVATFWVLQALQQAAPYGVTDTGENVRDAIRWLKSRTGDFEIATLLTFKPGLPAQRRIAQLLRNDPTTVDPLLGYVIPRALSKALSADDARLAVWRPPATDFACCAKGRDSASPACVQKAALHAMGSRTIGER